MAFKVLTGLIVVFFTVASVWCYDAILYVDSPTKDIDAPVGENFSITCVLIEFYKYNEFTTLPTLQWSRPNRSMEYDGNKILKQEYDKRLMLTITDPTVDDSGIYNCTALNGTTHVSKTEVFINFHSREPTFERSYENVTVEESANLKLTCEAKGIPPMKYQWYDQHEDKIMDFGNWSGNISEESNGSVLTIDGIKSHQAGSYMCTARNQYGLASKIFQVIVLPKVSGNNTDEDKDIIYNITVLNVTSNSVIFDISPNKFHYVNVSYSEKLSYKYRSYVQWHKGDTYIIGNLVASGLYNFRFNIVPSKQTKRLIEVTLLPDVPDVILRKMNDGNLELEWHRMINDFSRNTIDKYVISYYTIRMIGGNAWDKKADCPVTIDVSTCSGNKHTISGLIRQQYYEINVRAHTSGGLGKPYTQKVYVA